MAWLADLAVVLINELGDTLSVLRGKVAALQEKTRVKLHRPKRKEDGNFSQNGLNTSGGDLTVVDSVKE